MLSNFFVFKPKQRMLGILFHFYALYNPYLYVSNFCKVFLNLFVGILSTFVRHKSKLYLQYVSYVMHFGYICISTHSHTLLHNYFNYISSLINPTTRHGCFLILLYPSYWLTHCWALPSRNVWVNKLKPIPPRVTEY